MEETTLANFRMKNAFTTTTLDISFLVLTTLRDAAHISHFPYLNEAANLALGILTVVQNMKDCRKGFQRLACDVCDLVAAVIEARSRVTAAGSFQQDVEHLTITLTSILDFVRGEQSKNIIRRMIGHNTDRVKVAEFRETIRQAIDIFELTSAVSTRGDIAHMVGDQREVLSQVQEIKGLVQTLVSNLTYPSSGGTSFGSVAIKE